MKGVKDTVTGSNTSTVVRVYGPVRVYIAGTWGGGSAQVRHNDPDGIATDLKGGDATADYDKLFDFPPDAANEIWVATTGVTSVVVIIQARAQT